jgi:CheY-like chemotaxis protein
MRAYGIPLERLETGHCRVLFLDRDAEATEIVRDALEREARCEVVRADCAFDAGVQAEAFRPHMLVVDVSLPDVAPKELCRHVRGNPDMQHMKLIAAATALPDADGQALLQDGFDAYLNKPYEIRRLLDLIQQLSAG